MKRNHALAIALILAVSAGLGLAAATRTAGLRGHAAATTTTSQKAAVASRARKLNKIEASLRKALRDKPPALPPVPTAGRAPAVAPQPRVVYRRPAPIVVIKHRAGHEAEHESEGGGDD